MEEYVRAEMLVTEFRKDDVITTSEPVRSSREYEIELTK